MPVQSNDPAASTATQTMLPIDGVSIGSISDAADRDWLAVELVFGIRYTFTVTGIGGQALAAPEFVLRNNVGSERTASRGSDPATAEFFALVTGTHYIDVGAVGGATGRYALAISDGTADAGTTGEDTIVASATGQTFTPGAGFDTVHGAGSARVNLNGLDGGGFDLLRFDGLTYALDRADGSYDTLVAVAEIAAHGVVVSSAPTFDPLAYAASHDDLATSLGTNGSEALDHYLTAGFFAGHETTFDPAQYLENWSDLATAFGTDLAGATRHFLQSGVAEDRLAEDPLDYIASYADLIFAFSGNDEATLSSLGLQHYMAAGQNEGRRGGIDFDPQQYLANWGDLTAAFGTNDDAAAVHYINAGFAEGRLASDPLDYVASNPDLTIAFGDLDAGSLRPTALSHWQSNGRNEGRPRETFDVDAYLANYADLRAAFARSDGTYDEAAATLHYIRNGFDEGRTDDLIV